MAKYILKDYRTPQFFALNSSSTTYILTCEKISFLGLRKREVEIKQEVPDHVNISEVHEKWDKLIKTQKPLK